MKIQTLIVSIVLLAASYPSFLCAQAEDPRTSRQRTYSEIDSIQSSSMDSLTNEALKRAAKKQRELFEELFPKPEKFGKGWLLPWQLPKPHNKFTKESFWQQPWAADSKSKMETAAVLVELSPKELDSYLDAAIAEAKRQIPDDFLPPGITIDRFILGTVLMGWRIWNAGDLKNQSLLLTSAMAETAKLKREALNKKEEEGDDLDKKISMVVLDMILKPFKNMSTAQIRKALEAEVATVQEMTAMTYLKCDDWKRLGSQDEDAGEIHMGTLAIGLVVTEPDASSREKSDLLPEEISRLSTELLGHINSFKQSMIKIVQSETRRKLDGLEEQLKNTQNEEARRRIMQEIEETEKEAKAKIDAYRALAMKVSLLDVGDNCYGVEMSGKGVDKLETPFPFSLNNIRLRNGNAVVSIGMGGNYPPQHLQNDLKKILRKMDGVTGFFRK